MEVNFVVVLVVWDSGQAVVNTGGYKHRFDCYSHQYSHGEKADLFPTQTSVQSTGSMHGISIRRNGIKFNLLNFLHRKFG